MIVVIPGAAYRTEIQTGVKNSVIQKVGLSIDVVLRDCGDDTGFFPALFLHLIYIIQQLTIFIINTQLHCIHNVGFCHNIVVGSEFTGVPAIKCDRDAQNTCVASVFVVVGGSGTYIKARVLENFTGVLLVTQSAFLSWMNDIAVILIPFHAVHFFVRDQPSVIPSR